MLKKNDLKNIDLLLAKKEIGERFEKILTNLRKTVEQNGYAVQTIERFRECLENPEDNDVTRLPFRSFNYAFSLKHNKIKCVLCVVSYTIQLYWAFCMFKCDATYQLEKDKLYTYLSELENYAAKGLAAFKIAGTKYPDGYYLEEIK